MTAVSVVLDRAADVIERKGWTRGTGWADVRKPDAPCCLEGALMWAQEDPEMKLEGGRVRERDGNHAYKLLESSPPYLAVLQYLREHGVLHLGSGELYVWNDRNGRTEEQVVQLLRDVATVERQKGN